MNKQDVKVGMQIVVHSMEEDDENLPYFQNGSRGEVVDIYECDNVSVKFEKPGGISQGYIWDVPCENIKPYEETPTYNFSIGEKVVVESEEYLSEELQINKVYEISWVEDNKDCPHGYVLVMVEGCHKQYFSHRFKRYEEQTPAAYQFKTGDKVKLIASSYPDGSTDGFYEKSLVWGEIYTVREVVANNFDLDWCPSRVMVKLDRAGVMICASMLELVEHDNVDESVIIDTEAFDNILEQESQTTWTDSHYNCYHALTEKELASGQVRVDAYFVSKNWKLGSKDESGALFHVLKTLQRFGDKNPVEREIRALYAQVKRLAELNGVVL